MRTSSKTAVKRTQTAALIAGGIGLALVSAAAVLTLNPRYRKFITKPFRPYVIIPGYVVPGYTPGYTAPAPGYVAPGYVAPGYVAPGYTVPSYTLPKKPRR